MLVSEGFSFFHWPISVLATVVHEYRMTLQVFLSLLLAQWLSLATKKLSDVSLPWTPN